MLETVARGAVLECAREMTNRCRVDVIDAAWKESGATTDDHEVRLVRIENAHQNHPTAVCGARSGDRSLSGSISQKASGG